MEERYHCPRRGILLKVTEADYKRLQDLAEVEGKSLCGWCLDVLLSVARHPSGTAIEQAVLSELIAIRTIVGNLIYAFVNGGTVTREQMFAFIDRADKMKLKRATEFLTQVQRAEVTLLNYKPKVSDGKNG